MEIIPKKNEKRISLLFVMFLICVVCIGTKVDARQTKKKVCVMQDDFTQGILQDGGFLEEQAEEEPAVLSYLTGSLSSNSLSSLSDNQIQAEWIAADYKGAQQALLSAWESLADEVSIEDYHIKNAEYKAFFQEALNQSPQCFYVYGGGSHSYDEVSGEVIAVYPKYRYTSAQIVEKKKEFSAAVKTALAGVDKNWSDLEKALYLNDYLVKTIAYDQTYTKGTSYDALVGHSSVCNGYALAYKYLLNLCDVPCELVTSNAVNHAWNIVKVAGSAYHVDVTWNDPIPDKIGRVQHKQFLKSTSAFKTDAVLKDHYAKNDWVYGGDLKDSDASDKSFDSFFWDNVNAAMLPIDGYWYVTDTTGAIKKYKCSNHGKTWKEVSTIYDGQQVWQPVDGSGYYPKRYTILEYDPQKKLLYYSLPNSVMVYDVSSGMNSVAYSMSSDEKKKGSIYGMTIENGAVKVLVSKSPNEAGSQKTAFTLSSVSKPGTQGGNQTGGNESSDTQIKPAKTTISKATGKKKAIYLKWKKKTVNVNGYQIQYSTSKKFTKKTTKSVTIKGTKTTSKTIKKLKSKKTYYVRIRTYRNAKVSGKTKKVYSGWSKKKKVTTK